ncbi:MAG: methionine ABC transporter ATP-binding protein [Kiritimatiellia bacterium]
MIVLDKVNVTFRARNAPEVHAVRDVTLHVQPGEFFGIVGTSGAGKSTLLRTINYLEKPSSGRVTVARQDLGALDPERLRRARLQIGMIFQHYNLLQSKTVFENVAFPLKIAGVSEADTRRRVDELLDLVELTPKQDVHPSRLSGGQKQRVGIARALANHPRVLLCDEPTSALDLETSSAILDLLKTINTTLGITVVLISHEMQVIKKVCTRVAVMQDGLVVENGTVYDIFAKPQHPVTVDLVNRVQSLQLPKRLLANGHGDLVKIHYRGERAEEPVIAETLRRFPVTINILHGTIEYIGESPLGTLVVGIQGEAVAREGAREHIRQRVAGLEILHVS